MSSIDSIDRKKQLEKMKKILKKGGLKKLKAYFYCGALLPKGEPKEIDRRHIC